MRSAIWAAKTPAEKRIIHEKKMATRAAKWKTCESCGERYHSGWLIGHDHDADPICRECEPKRDAILLEAVKQKR